MSSSYSCEKRRTSPYSEDLRWRIVWKKEALGLRTCDVARSVNVDSRTVRRVLRRFRLTGSVEKTTPVHPRLLRKLSLPLRYKVADLIFQRPGIYLRELLYQILQDHGEEISESAICRFLQRSGFTRQKLKITASQRDDLVRANFISEVSIYNPDMFIFLDETGSDRHNSVRRYGYCPRGKPLVSRVFLSRGVRINSIAFLSVSGLLDCKTYKHTINGETFYNFVQSSLLPHLMPFDGYNPHSIVVMDNCSIHHVQGIKTMIEEVGALLLFLPPYSLDLNPIEEAFSKVKCVLRQMDKEAESCDDPEELVLRAFSTITARDCTQWINDSGIYM